MIGAFITTIISRLILIMFLLATLPCILAIVLLPQSWISDSRFFAWYSRLFYIVVLRSSWMPITFTGLQSITSEPAIIVANHQSSFDIPIIGYAMNGYSHLWLAWINLMKSPLLRFLLPKVAILVDMSSPTKGFRTLIQAIKRMDDSKGHVIVFPEGGRYTDGKIHSFFGGFVILAKKTGRPVVPIKIIGIDKVYPPNAFVIRNYPVQVIVGEPMRMQEGESDDAFKERVYQWFVLTKGN